MFTSTINEKNSLKKKSNANETKVEHGSEMFNNIWGIQI